MLIPEVIQHSQLLVGRARNATSTLPPGAVVDYLHGPSRGYQILVASGLTIAAASIAVVVRIFTKFSVTHSPGWDDYTSIVALAFAIVRVVGSVVLVKKYGVGHHLYDVHPYHFHHLLTWYQIDNVFYLMAILFAKISILLLYLRLFKVNRIFRHCNFVLMGLVVGYCVSLALSILFACKPIARTWDSSIPGTCPVGIEKVDFAIGGFNIFTDTAILILPIPILWRLQISTARLIGLMLVFGTGAFVVATSIIREVIVIRTLKDLDQTWSMVDDIVWLTVEVNIGIFCGCLPVLPALFNQVLTKDRLISQYHSLVNLLRSSNSGSKKREDSEAQSSWSSHTGRTKEEYLELVGEQKVAADATSRALHESF